MSGQQIGTVIGGAVGTFVPVVGTAAGMAIGGAIGGLIAPEKLPDQYGPRLPDSKITLATFGNMVQRFFGQVRGAGQVIFSTPQQEVENVDEGKGGPTQKTTTYLYKRSFAISLGEGPILGVSKILADTKLIFNNTEGASVATLIASHKNGNIRIYLGTEDQLPDPFIQAFAGAEVTSAYRGTAYVMFEDFYLEEFGNRIPNFEFEVIQKGRTKSVVKTVSKVESPNDINMVLVNDKAYNFYTDPYDDYKTKMNLFKVIQNESRLQPIGGQYIMPQKYSASAPYITKSEDDSIVFLQKDDENFYHLYYLKIEALPELSTDEKIETASVVSDLSNLYKLGKDVDESIRNPWISLHAYINKYKFQVVCGRSGFAESNYTLAVLNRNVSPNSFNYKVSTDLILNDMDMSPNYIYTVENYNKVYKYNLDLSNKTLFFESTDVRNICVINDNQIFIYGLMQGTTGIYEISSGSTKTMRTGISLNADNMSYDGINFFFKYHNEEKISTETFEAQDTPLSEVITTICTLANYDINEFDVSSLNQNVHGYMLTRIDSAAGNLKPLAQNYFFDLIENDDVLEFVNRGSDPVVDIPARDMAAHSYGGDTPDNVETMRRQETDLVNELTVQYYDINSGFQIGAQFARRNTGTSNSVNASSVQLPISLTANEAASTASIMLNDYWQTRHTFTFQLSNKYAYLTPTDVVRIEKDGTYYTVRILDIEEQNGVFKITACSEDKTKYNQKSVGAILPAAKQEIEQVSPTNLQMMDIPLLRDEDDQKGIYLAVAGYSQPWRGCQLNKSSDGGVSYNSTGNIYSKQAGIGYAKTALHDFKGNIFDETSFVDVVIYDTELITTTEQNVLNGANPALVGNEIIQFKRAQFLSKNNYRLSGFIRGKRGTEWRKSNHQVNERFVLLDATKLNILQMPTSEYDLLRYYKAVSYNESLDEASALPFQNTGMAQECYSPVHLGGGKSNNDFILKWVRRGRINNEWNNKIDVPIGESVEAYEIEILSGDTVKRVISTNITQIIYSSAQQIEDFGANQSSVKFRVYQLSTLRGRGIPATQTI